jgi:predicted dehydrogenase
MNLTRREFLQVAAATAITHPSKEVWPVQTAIIGLGDQGTALLWSMIKQNVDIVGLCDINDQKLAYALNIIKTYKQPTEQICLYHDYREMLDNWDLGLEAVIIATPPYLHVPMSIYSLQNGFSVYCEKPLATEFAELKKLKDHVLRAQKNKQVFQSGLQLRYSNTHKQGIEYSHKIFELTNSLWIDSYRRGKPYPRTKLWAFDPKKSGDVIVEQCVHEFDIFNQCFQSLPSRGFGTKYSSGGTSQNFSIMLKYGNDQNVIYTNSRTLELTHPGYGRNTFIYGKAGTLSIEDGIWYQVNGQTKPGAEKTKIDDSYLLRDALDDFFKCVRSGESPKADFMAGYNATLVGLFGRECINAKWQKTLDFSNFMKG